MTDKTAEILKPYREKIDSLDRELIDLLVRREKIIHEVAKIKHENNIPAVLQSRVDEVRENAVKHALEKGGDAHYMREIYKTIIQLSCDIEDNIKNITRSQTK
ncbi:MAG: chorismate mutase [Alphaproteobacteria bacterium]|nr:chorismate mutase [Alphaproteobacteria bacterium]